jgi:hypothetical protein
MKKILNDNGNEKILLQMKMIEKIFLSNGPICSKIAAENFEFLQPFTRPAHVQQTYYHFNLKAYIYGRIPSFLV